MKYIRLKSIFGSLHGWYSPIKTSESDFIRMGRLNRSGDRIFLPLEVP